MRLVACSFLAMLGHGVVRAVQGSLLSTRGIINETQLNVSSDPESGESKRSLLFNGTELNVSAEATRHALEAAHRLDGALQRLLESAEKEAARRRQTYKGKALIVDPRGPSRMQGEGVRVMGMLLDLEGEDCHMEVDILVNTNNYDAIRSSWSESVQQKYLSNVHFVRVSDYNRGLVKLASYSRIIIGGKADLMRPGGAGVVSTVIADLVALSGADNLPTSLRARTSVFWDDVPFERCVVDNSCATVAPTVAQLAGAASVFYVLTSEDAARMSSHMRHHGIQPLAMRVWPMRIANMIKVLRKPHGAEPVEDVPVERKLFALMMGNHHPVNTKNLEVLFKSKVLSDLCNEIQKRQSPVKLLLGGAMTQVAHKLLQTYKQSNTDCLVIKQGFLSNAELETEILPHTRAIINPFFFDVKSGISVKSFEAIMEGFPLVTSFYGLHGLNDIPGCKFPQPADPNAAQSFRDFFLTHIVEDKGPRGYHNFSAYFRRAAEDCIAGQNAKYPAQQICEG